MSEPIRLDTDSYNIDSKSFRASNNGYIIIALLVTFSIISFVRTYFREHRYFRHLNLELTGVIISMDCGGNYNGFCVLNVRVITSNIREYDPRGKLKNYFCVIKDTVAEIYQCADTFFIKLGDSIYVDSNKEQITYKNGSKRIINSLSGPSDDERFYEHLKEEHQKF